MVELSLSQTSSAPNSPLKAVDISLEHDLQLQQKAVRKLDYTILPVMTIFYLLAFLDRANIGNARVAGFQKDIHLSDRQYQICITAVYVPYILSELPSNLLFRKIGPRFLLPTVVTLWGIVATMQGFVTSYAGLVTVRTLLGLFEGPLTPGIILYLSSFYTRKELSLRIALFFSSASLSGAFSGLLAAAINRMNGIGGKPGWAWIFILEGLLSVLVGLVGFFLVPSTVCDSRFLTECQKDVIMKRIEQDRPFVKPVDRFSLKEILRAVTSPHVIIVLIMGFMLGSLVYGVALFLPSIVNQLGFGPNETQLLSVGPFAAGFCVTLISALLSDRYDSRGIPTALISMLSIVGFTMYLTAEHKLTSYGALYLITPGVYGIMPIAMAWIANNSEPHYRRATSVALGTMANNAGGILSTWSFPTKEGPKFRKTTIMNLIFSILVVVGALANVAYLSWRNKVKKLPGVRSKLLEKYVAATKEGDNGELRAWVELGDQHPDFVYTL